ncbi:hypothetical protein AAHC03_04335 [Spirometra sp. Aus1]
MAWDESMTYRITFRSEDTVELKGGYNGGVLLLHLDRLRQRGWTKLWRRALNALHKFSSVLKAAEQLNDAANGSACLHSRSLAGSRLAERPNAKLLHMNRQDKFEYRDDDHLTPADVPATEMTVDDRLQWYLVERKKVTLLNGYNFVDTTAQLSRGELEQIFQQIHSNAKFPTNLPFCTENMDIQKFCVKAAPALHVPRMHAYFVDRSGNQEMQTLVGTSLVVLANPDSLPRLREISKFWRGPISVAICASDRQAFRLPLLLSWSTGLSVRRDIIFHTVYAYEFQLLKRASAVLLPTETALVPPEAAADSIFELLVWNLLGSFPDAYTVVTLSTTSRGDARGHV